MSHKKPLMDVLLEIKKDFPKAVFYGAYRTSDARLLGMSIDEVIGGLREDLDKGAAPGVLGNHYWLMVSMSTGQVGVFHDDDDKNAMLVFLKGKK